MKVVLLENIHPVAAEAFRRAGFEVDARPGSLSESELCDVLPGVSLLGIRSNTKVTPRVLEAGKDLLAVGFERYRERDFGRAMAQFAQAMAAAPNDPVPAILFDRSRRLLADPPGEGWDGVERLTHK